MFLCPPVICRQAELQKSGSAPPFACDRRPPRAFGQGTTYQPPAASWTSHAR